jgi:hypothetical protein
MPTSWPHTGGLFCDVAYTSASHFCVALDATRPPFLVDFRKPRFVLLMLRQMKTVEEDA